VKRIWDEIGPPLAGIVALIVIWTIVAAATDTQSVPSPAQVWTAFLDGMRDGSIPEATLKTLVRLAFAFAMSIVIGVSIGVGMALNEFARRSVRPLIVALQITPFIAWVPLAVIWFGATERAVVFVTIVGAFPSMTLATLSAVRQVPPILTRAGRTMGARGWELYREVVVPAAMPGFVAGLQQAWGFAWKALMAAELIITAVGASGLGHLLAIEQNDVPALLAVLGVIVIIGVAVDYLVFHRLDRRVRKRRGLLVEG
jgi:NitT/TauT family transport system permease protein